MGEVRSLGAARANNSWSPGEMVEEAARLLEKGEIKATKAIIVFLDDEDEIYKMEWLTSRLKRSEVIALLECAKISHHHKMFG